MRKTMWKTMYTKLVLEGKKRTWIWYPYPVCAMWNSPARTRFYDWLRDHAQHFRKGDYIVVDALDYQGDIEEDLLSKREELMFF